MLRIHDSQIKNHPIQLKVVLIFLQGYCYCSLLIPIQVIATLILCQKLLLLEKTIISNEKFKPRCYNFNQVKFYPIKK